MIGFTNPHLVLVNGTVCRKKKSIYCVGYSKNIKKIIPLKSSQIIASFSGLSISDCPFFLIAPSLFCNNYFLTRRHIT